MDNSRITEVKQDKRKEYSQQGSNSWLDAIWKENIPAGEIKIR